MEIKNVTHSTLHRALIDADPTGNLIFARCEPINRLCTRWRVRLTVRDSRQLFARRGRGGRRISAACWHAHRRFLWHLFEHEPEATVKTALITYRGRDCFHFRHWETGKRNIGSQVEPLLMWYACECKNYHWGGAAALVRNPEITKLEVE